MAINRKESLIVRIQVSDPNLLVLALFYSENSGGGDSNLGVMLVCNGLEHNSVLEHPVKGRLHQYLKLEQFVNKTILQNHKFPRMTRRAKHKKYPRLCNLDGERVVLYSYSRDRYSASSTGTNQ